MPKDYKHRPRPRREKHAPCWAWLVVGILIGLFGTFLIYIREYPHLSLTGRQLPEAAAVAPTEAEQTPRPVQRPPKPRFEFYTVLPEMEVRVPDEQLPSRRSSKPKRASDSESYVLQVASFKSHEEADRLKARLALLGMEAAIQTVSVNGRQTWHRVRLGPFSNVADVEDLNRRLGEIDLKAIIFKVNS